MEGRTPDLDARAGTDQPMGPPLIAPNPPPAIDYLIVGHICADLVPGGTVLGGTATYAALAAARLGRRVGIVTSTGPELELSSLVEAGVALVAHPAARSTTYENRYQDGHRRQTLRARANDLAWTDVPAAWRAAPIVHLAPIARELPLDASALRAAFPRSLIGVTPQGWLRQWDGDGRVRPAPWTPDKLPLSAVILSEEDVAGDEATLAAYAAALPLLVVTRGRRGTRWHTPAGWHTAPAYRTSEVDPTGAGDVFAAAFLVRLAETGAPREAAHFANAAASYAIEALGLSGVPDRAAIEARVIQGQTISG